MKYEETFTDFEKLREGAYRIGFFHNDFSYMYNYLAKAQGIQLANAFADLRKKDKKKYCAILMAKNDPMIENRTKALKYLEKEGSVINDF